MTGPRYFAIIVDEHTTANPGGVIRRVDPEDKFEAQSFTRRLRWEFTDFFIQEAFGHLEDDYVEIAEAEAMAYVNFVTENVDALVAHDEDFIGAYQAGRIKLRAPEANRADSSEESTES